MPKNVANVGSKRMSSKISIDRGLLAEVEIALRQTGVDVSLSADLRKILAEPVIEVPPVSEDIDLLNIRISQLTVALDQSSKAQLENYHMATRAWTELAELQATIEQLTAENERLKDGQGEAVAWMALNRDGFPEKCLKSDPEGFPVYRSQPAPVSAINENAAFEDWRKEQIASLVRMGYPDAAKAFRDLGSIQWAGWQARACLDKVKEQNQ
jgi:hypothetical protein